jgi:predicted ribosomally synthesized peptide with nif11-like leader
MMSTQELQRLAQEMKADPALKVEISQALRGVTEPADASAALQARGYDVSSDDLRPATERNQAELTDDQLDGVVGGSAAMSNPFEEYFAEYAHDL